MSIGKRLRYEVLRRDNYTCRYCGASAPSVQLEVDHVVPQSLGGIDEPSNLVTSCEPCNAGKSSSSPDDAVVKDVAQDALRWSKAMEEAAKAQDAQNRLESYLVETLLWLWFDTFVGNGDTYIDDSGGWVSGKDKDCPFAKRYTYCIIWRGTPTELFDHYNDAVQAFDARMRRETPPKPNDWKKSVRSWARAGITEKDVTRVLLEMRDDRKYVAWDYKWRYFAGCMWNVLRSRQEIAMNLLDAGKINVPQTEGGA